MLGIGVAESSGLIGALIRMLVLSAPKRILTFVMVLAGVLSNIASDVGYVLLIPLAGIIFQAFIGIGQPQSQHIFAGINAVLKLRGEEPFVLGKVRRGGGGVRLV